MGSNNRRAASVSWPVPLAFNSGIVRRISGAASIYASTSIRNSSLPGGDRFAVPGLPLAGALLCLLAGLAIAQDPQQPIREIFVPFEDLNVILESQTQRVFLTRDEYQALVAQAKTTPEASVPHKVALTAADYSAELSDGRAAVTGTLTIQVLDEGLFALPLELAGVGIRAAMLDGKPAPLTQTNHCATVLLVQGKGPHTLVLELTAPLQTAAALQSLNVTLPTTTAAKLSLTVPGNVEVKGGAAVVERTFDMAAGRTRLELLPQRGGMSIVMSLNNRLLREQRVVVARSVLVDEVTQGYERIHATVSHRILHGAVDRLRFKVPAGFEVTRVESTLLARWEEKDEDGAKILEATLREPTTDQVVLEISANRSPQADQDWLAGLANWTFPRLEPLDVAGQVAVVGLLVEDRLKAENIQSTGLLPLDAAVLASAIPASVLKAEPGAPTVRQVVTYYAPAAAYNLTASFARPPAGLKVATNSLLVVADRGLTLTGGFALAPEGESLFEFRFTLPAGWQATQVTRADGTPLAIERFPTPDGGTRVLVRLGTGIDVGQSATVNFEAVHAPSGWLADWTTQTVEYPQIIVEGATDDSGAIAAQTVKDDDLLVRPDKLTGLVPLLDNEKAAFGLADLATALAYRYDERPIGATLVVERVSPSLMAEVYSFLRIEPDNLVAHYELDYEVREARTRRVAFTLPASTPAELSVTGRGETAVKEFRSSVEGTLRRWEVLLAQRQTGRVQLAVDFQQRWTGQQLEQGLPLVAAADVDYQSAFVAVEGDEELEIDVTTTARRVDMGDLAGTDYFTSGRMGRRVIGAFGYSGQQATIAATAVRREAYGLPPALVQKASLTTKVAASGRSQSEAAYELLTKATLLEFQLPAYSTLWTVLIDGQPTKPQREGDSLLVSLPARQALSVRKLSLFYETNPRTPEPLRLAGRVNVAAPVLLVRSQDAGNAEKAEVPQADLDWTLHLPRGYTVRRAEGTVFTDDLPERTPAVAKVAAFLYELAGGIQPWWLMRQAARDAEVSNQVDGYSYYDAPKSAPTTSATPPPGTAEFDSAMPQSEAPAEMAEAVPPPLAAPEPNMPAREPARDDNEAAQRELQRLQQELILNAQTKSSQQQPVQPAEPPPSQPPAPQPGEDGRPTRLAALEGVSSIKIALQADPGGESVLFRSLGDDPRLVAAVVENRRVQAAAWGLALLVFLVGVGLTFHSARRQATYTAIVLLASTVPVLFTDRLNEVAVVFDYVFFAGCALAAYFPLAAFVIATARWIKSRLPADCCGYSGVDAGVNSRDHAAQIASLVIFSLALGSADQLVAQDAPEASGIRILNVKEILPLLEPDAPPVPVPPDAVIVPYDPEQPNQRLDAQKLLVPYEKYLELWNRAHPDKKIATTPPPADYALAGTRYEATLGATDSLVLKGMLEIEVYTDKPVAVPLHLSGGVLVKATLDGAAARLQVVQSSPETAAQQPAQQAANPAPNSSEPPPPRLLLLHLSDKGRKKLELTIQMGLTRQGGWRIVRGRVPVGPAGALTLAAPLAGTEVRQQNLADRPQFETSAANETIETALGADGLLDLQWRAKITEGEVDKSLTAKSSAVLDVREDALRLTWQVHLEFGRGIRDAFTLAVPQGYLVEAVTGVNVRGWTAKEVGSEQSVDVTLLKPAQGSETLTIELARRGRVGEADLAEFDAPTVLVVDAQLQQGELAVRRSPRLELRTVASTGLSRADAAGQTAEVEQLASSTDAGVLLVQPFQTFRFVRAPFSLRLAARAVPQTTSVEVRAILDAAERGTTLDAAFVFNAQGQPLYEVEILLPAGFELTRLSPADLEWTIATENGRPKLTVHLLQGRTGTFTLAVLGKIATAPIERSAEGNPLPRQLAAPAIEVLGVQKQEGQIVVLTDRDTDLRLADLVGAESGNVAQAGSWLAGDLAARAKGAIRYRGPGYGATIHLTPRTAQVSVRTITNVKVTPRAIEETILLEFRIEQAGVRRLSFLLPERLAKARFLVKLLKQKTIEPASDDAGQPIAGWVRVRLELQDYVQDEFRINVLHDRLLTSAKQEAAIPRLDAGIRAERYVVLENAGRDEVVVGAADQSGLMPLSPQQQAWRELAAVLGDKLTQAYLVSPEAQEPRLAFQTQERARAETAQARIPLASTVLVVDRAGTYRALQEYRVVNATEQYLEVELPAGATLWTAVVAGQPVKPIQSAAAGAASTLVRIPLIKTAEGDADYPVQLKYGGRMPEVASLSAVRFPLVKTVNINVELSQVRLLLPSEYEWFDFRGTLRQVDDQAELREAFQSYLNKRIVEAKEMLSSANPYTQMRAQNNLKQAKVLLDSSRSMQPADAGLYERNSSLLSEAEGQIQQQQAAQQAGEQDNRYRLNYLWSEQTINRSKAAAGGQTSNFDLASQGLEEKPDDAKQNSFNDDFYRQNALGTKGDAGGKEGAKPQESQTEGGEGKGGGRFFRGKMPADFNPPKPGSGERGDATQNPQLFNDAQKDSLQKQLKQEGDEIRELESQTRRGELDNLSRYGQQLEQHAQQQEQFGLNAFRGSGQGQLGGGQGSGRAGGMGMEAGGAMPQASGAPGPSGGFSAPGLPTPGDPSAVPRPATGMTAEGLPESSAADYGQIAAGLASLDFALPERGREYNFTTPRGEVELLGRPVAHSLLQRFAGIGVLAAVIALAWALTRRPARAFYRQVFGTLAAGIAIAALGLMSVVSGVFPIAGLALLAAGIILAIRSRCCGAVAV